MVIEPHNPGDAIVQECRGRGRAGGAEKFVVGAIENSATLALKDNWLSKTQMNRSVFFTEPGDGKFARRWNRATLSGA